MTGLIPSINEYLCKHRKYYNEKGEIGIWACNDDFKNNPFTNDDILIEDFPNVKFLYICDHSLNSNATDGGLFSFWEYEIDKVEVGVLSSVQTIQLYRNNINVIDFTSTYPNCLSLDISGNNLTELDLTPFPNLEHLDISNNLIERIDLSKCPNLETFTCAYSPLVELDLSGNDKLRTLWLLNGYVGVADVDTHNDEAKLTLSWEKIIKVLETCGKNLKSLNIEGLVELNKKSLKELLFTLDPDRLEDFRFTFASSKVPLLILSKFENLKKLFMNGQKFNVQKMITKYKKKREAKKKEWIAYLYEKPLPALPKKKQGKLKVWKQKLINKVNKIIHRKEQEIENQYITQVEIKSLKTSPC